MIKSNRPMGVCRYNSNSQIQKPICRGATHAHPEAIEASLRLGETALQLLQIPPAEIGQVVQNVRDLDYKPVLEKKHRK